MQGYDAVHLGRYDAYLRVLNGRDQNYHNADIFARGLTSPLLDLLNARYVVVLADMARTSGESGALPPHFVLRHLDHTVAIYENRRALPRAWIVHEATPAGFEEALCRLDDGSIDPHRVALVEPPARSPFADVLRAVRDVPWLGRAIDATGGSDATGSDVAALVGRLERPNASQADTVTLELEAADALVIRTETGAPGLLVLSEQAYPGWHASVDGRPAPIYVANGIFRSVEVPPGVHVVELRFDSASLRLGMLVTLGTVLATLVALVSRLTLAPPRTGPCRTGGSLGATSPSGSGSVKRAFVRGDLEQLVSPVHAETMRR